MGLCSSSTSTIQPGQPTLQDDNFTDLRKETKRVMATVHPRLTQAVKEFSNGELSFDRIPPTTTNGRISTKQRRQLKSKDPNAFTDKHVAALVGSDQLDSPLLNMLISSNGVATPQPNNTAPTFEKIKDPTSGKVYYFCEQTGETQWKQPENFIEVRPVETLSLCDHFLTDAGCPSIASVINWSHACLSLTVLRLRENNITDQGAECLAEAMFSPCCTLQTLELQGNAIGDRGLTALAASLHNGILRVLALDRQQKGLLGTVGITALSDALSNRSTCKLRKLSLSGNKGIDDACATVLARAMVGEGKEDGGGGSSGLEELYLSGTGICDPGAIALASSLFTLRNLSLSGCRIKDKGGESIALAEKTATQLRGLDIQGNYFSPATIQLLVDSALPDCLVSVSVGGSSYSS